MKDNIQNEVQVRGDVWYNVKRSMRFVRGIMSRDQGMNG